MSHYKSELNYIALGEIIDRSVPHCTMRSHLVALQFFCGDELTCGLSDDVHVSRTMTVAAASTLPRSPRRRRQNRHPRNPPAPKTRRVNGFISTTNVILILQRMPNFSKAS